MNLIMIESCWLWVWKPCCMLLMFCSMFNWSRLSVSFVTMSVSENDFMLPWCAKTLPVALSETPFLWFKNVPFGRTWINDASYWVATVCKTRLPVWCLSMYHHAHVCCRRFESMMPPPCCELWLIFQGCGFGPSQLEQLLQCLCDNADQLAITFLNLFSASALRNHWTLPR